MRTMPRNGVSLPTNFQARRTAPRTSPATHMMATERLLIGIHRRLTPTPDTVEAILLSPRAHGPSTAGSNISKAALRKRKTQNEIEQQRNTIPDNRAPQEHTSLGSMCL